MRPRIEAAACPAALLTLSTQERHSAFRDMSPPRLSPCCLLHWIQERPGNQAPLFLALAHDDSFVFKYFGSLQRRVDTRQTRRLGHQRAEPKTTRGNLRAFLDHLLDKGLLTPRAPQFRVLTTEVQSRLRRLLAILFA